VYYRCTDFDTNWSGSLGLSSLRTDILF